jgi:hypothetical protein
MLRLILTAFALLAVAVSALGSTIQRIEVRGAQRVPARIVVDETLLREGRDYSADDVRNAVARVRRLPFIADAGYTLDNGVLVITVTEVRRISFLVDARGISLNDENYLTSTDYDFPDPTAEWTNAAAGARWLTRGGGVAHFGLTVLRNRHAFGINYSAYELGYTQYDLFGSRVFATVNVRSPADSLEEKTFTPAATIGVPLTSTQTVTLDYLDTLFRRETVHIAGNTLRRLQAERILTLAWTYDTRNAAYTASRGSFVRVAPFRYMQDFGSFSILPPPRSFVGTTAHINADGVDIGALHYWELSDVNSVSAGLFGSWASLEQTPDLSFKPAYQIVQGGWSRALGGGRLALDARLIARQHDSVNDGDRHAYEVAASWAWRGVWGTFRFGAAYEKGD